MSAATHEATADLRALVEQYYAAYANKDIDAAMAQWSSQSPDLAAHCQAVQQFFAANDKIIATVVFLGAPAIENDKAQLRVTVEMSAVDAKSQESTQRLGKLVHDFECTREQGRWKIWKETDAVANFAAALTAAPSEQEISALLSREKDLVTPNLALLLIQQGADLAGRDFSKALGVLTLAQHIAEQLDDQAALSSAYRNVGVVYKNKGDHDQAMSYYQKSLEIAEKVNSPKLVANALNSIGNVQMELGNYESALDYYEKSLKRAEPTHDDQLIAKIIGNMGPVFIQQGRYAEAEKYLREALVFQEKAGNEVNMAFTLTNLGALADAQSNYAGALAFYQRALALFENQGNWLRVGQLSTNMGTVLTGQGNYVEALACYRKGLAIAEEVGAKPNISGTLMYMGDLEGLQRHYEAALQDYQRSLALAEELGSKGRIADLIYDLGDIYALKADYTAALDWHLKGLKRSEELGISSTTADACSAIALDYYSQGELEKAAEFAERASDIARNIGEPATFFQARTNAGKIYLALGRTAQARQAFQEAIDAVETMRSEVAGGEEERQHFFGSKVAPYQEMVKMLVAQGESGEALMFAERARGKALLDVLHDGKIQITRAMTGAERDREQQLEGKLVSLNTKIQMEKQEARPDLSRINTLKSQLEQVRIEYNQFQIGLYAAHPELRVRRGQVEPLTLEQAAQLLPEESAALLEFLVTEKTTYLFVITKKIGDTTPELKVYPIEIKVEDLEGKAEEFRQKLAQHDLSIRAAARQIYDLLLKPAQQQLAGKNALLIVPDGPLWNLPFQALEHNNHYLVEQRAIAYAPSLTVLREMMHLRQKNRQANSVSDNSTLLAMADPMLGKESLAHATIVYRDEKLGPLPEARRETEALRQLYGSRQSRVYTGADAREDRFKSEAGKFRILHLATHSILDNASPMYSNILLAPGASGQEDGLLEAREIMQMDLKADLVVLSACETARGHVSPGEGVVGLSWAFFVAGTSTTVVSQWKVESLSTASLMLAFHRALVSAQASGNPAFSVARALQRAEIRLLHHPKYEHPFYWAGFIVVGDPS